LVEGDDPYYAGPRAVSDPDAWSTALGQGDGLPYGPVEGAWADLGVTLAGALDVTLPGATAAGMCPAALAGA
ncbi:MAG: phosphodiesterase, partial [Pseudoxanthomonas suwonensis]